jgi:hypothetical protein
MDALEETGLTPPTRLLPAARQCVIDLGIVRRRKVDVAADIPARRIADLPSSSTGGRPVDPGGRAGPRRAHGAQYRTALAARARRLDVDGIDLDLVRRVARRS